MPERDCSECVRMGRDFVEAERTQKDHAKGTRKRDGARDQTARGMGTVRVTETSKQGTGKVVQEWGQ